MFGLDGAEVAPYRTGKVREVVPGPGDRLIGQSANVPDDCIYARSASGVRFRAACPDGFEL
ncbi:hypothetical protein ASG48_15515 [Aurantimonas sp. Leaf443]|nr:hypothetical protein ASG48_15515 [Aurantimonas sp. Leaf443]